MSAPQRREALLDAALARFAEHGYESASIAEIARGAGVTKPVLYDHFPSKRDLYIALLEREAAAMSDALTTKFDPEASLDERLRTLAYDAVVFARARDASVRFLWQVPTGEPALREAHEDARASARRSFTAAILADPVFQPASGLSRRASAELLGDLHNAVLERLVNWAIEHPRTPASALGEVFVDVLWTGLSGAG